MYKDEDSIVFEEDTYSQSDIVDPEPLGKGRN